MLPDFNGQTRFSLTKIENDKSYVVKFESLTVGIIKFDPTVVYDSAKRWQDHEFYYFVPAGRFKWTDSALYFVWDRVRTLKLKEAFERDSL